MSEIKAIPTTFRGFRFRSRLEVRWAILFDALEIEWDYEREGYRLDSGWYLPDFYFPKTKSFAEVKGQKLPAGEIAKIGDLCRMTGSPVLALVGSPDLKQYEMYGPYGPAGAIKPILSRLYKNGEEGKFRSAVFASRSARFDHGEQPKQKVKPSPIAVPVVPTIAAEKDDSELLKIFETHFEEHVSRVVLDIRQIQRVWNRLLTDAGKISKNTELQMSRAYPIDLNGNAVTVIFSDRDCFEKMNEPSKKTFIEKLLARCLNVDPADVSVRFTLEAVTTPVDTNVPLSKRKALKRDPLAELLALDTVPVIGPPTPKRDPLAELLAMDTVPPIPPMDDKGTIH